MKIFRKIRVFFYIICSIFVVISFVIFFQYLNQIKEEKQINKIQNLIDQERSGAQLLKPESEKNNIDIDKIVHDSINSSLVTPVFSEVTMINSSTFMATLNGERKTYHLIGVADDGNLEDVKSIIERLESITITYDAKEEKNGILQIYLWSGSIDNLNNMINIQIVKQKLCGTSYKINSGSSETPNVKYSNSFLSASK